MTSQPFRANDTTGSATHIPVDVLVVYQHLPHYRYGVFKALESDPRLSVHFCADTQSRDGSIATIDPALLTGFTRTRNHWFGPALVQIGPLVELIRRRPHAVIFLGDFRYLSTWVGAVLGRLLGIKVFFWTQGWRVPEAGLKSRVRLAFYGLAHTLLVYGNRAVEIGAGMGFPRTKMIPVGNSVSSSLEVDRLGSETTDLNIPDRAPNGVTLGAVLRVTEPKRLDLLIEAAAQLSSSGPPHELIIAGEGPARAGLERLAADLNIRVHFVGPVYLQVDLDKIYARMDVCVIPEAAGLSVVQSLDHGTPVVTHDSPVGQGPEVEAISPGVNGQFYKRGDMSDLVQVIRDLLVSIRNDPAAIATRCRDSLENGGWQPQSQADRIADAVLTVIEEDR